MRANFLARHRAHDYPHLVGRWRAVAKKTGLVMRKFAATPDFNLYSLRTRNLPRTGVIYISAGIHGDEPAGTEALITWAEKNTRLLCSRPFLIVPCINPWGLVNNIRRDANGHDLNRSFQDDSIAEIAALKRLLEGRIFSLALLLHEDYDARGVYIYEVPEGSPAWGEALLEAGRPYIIPDPRDMVEGRPCVGGLIRRVVDDELLKMIKEMGVPEALHLYFQDCKRVFTIETPSEYSLDLRIRAHMAIIQEAVRRVGR